MSTEQERRSIVLLAVVFEGGLAVLAWLLGLLVGQPSLQNCRLNLVDVCWGLAAVLPMLLFFAAAVRWPLGPLARVKEFSERVIRPMFQPCTLADFFLIALLAGVGEEMLFRGMLQDALASRLGLWPAIAIANALFGLLHCITPAYAFMTAMMGLYLSWVYVGSGNLLTAMVAHGLYDFLALLYLVRIHPTPTVVEGD